MQRFRHAPDAFTQPGNPHMTDLIYGWGNAGWSAKEEYLAQCIAHALEAPGPILECGSGLTTILLGTIATQRGYPHWALEHTPAWATKVQRYLRRYTLDAVVLCVTPLKDYGLFWWYDAPVAALPSDFALVICDGPPYDTQGGRYGLVPRMRERLQPGCVILLDDAERAEERAIARRWAAELGAPFTIRGATKPYIEMVVRSSPPRVSPAGTFPPGR
jgi:hypothetical protein